ncbi:MAG: hypothetical protein LBR79_01525, partial [Oscillospiraceae bacterium]|nr:hypothetical protein [Oscillospiraceae bacterium]
NCFFPPPTRGGKNVNNTMFLNDFGYNIAVPFEKRLIFITFSQPSAGRKYTDKFTFDGYFKS